MTCCFITSSRKHQIVLVVVKPPLKCESSKSDNKIYMTKEKFTDNKILQLIDTNSVITKNEFEKPGIHGFMRPTLNPIKSHLRYS